MKFLAGRVTFPAPGGQLPDIPKLQELALQRAMPATPAAATAARVERAETAGGGDVSVGWDQYRVGLENNVASPKTGGFNTNQY